MLNDIEAFATSLAKAARASRHTVSNYRRDLMSLRAFLLERGSLVDANGEVAVDAITADHVRQYLAELMRNEAARATVQRRLSAIKAFFRYRESNLGATSPVRALRSPKSQRHLPSILQESDAKRLIEHRPDAPTTPAMVRDRAILEVLYSSGLRVSELTGLCWRDVDDELGMVMVRRHYDRVLNAIASPTPLELTDFRPALVVVPIQRWSIVAKKAVRFALTISPEIIGLQIGAEQTDDLRSEWEQYVEKPVMEIGLPTPKLVVLTSPYRFVLMPIVDYVLELQKKDPSRQIAVVIPELVERHWYYYFLHNQRAAALKALLYVKGNEQIAVVNVPWYLDF